MKPTDQQLWGQLKEGDQLALEKIYTTHIDYLLQYGNRFSHDSLLVEDCVHDLFVDLWRNRSGLSMTNSIRAYLLVSLRRSIIKKVQKKQKHLTGNEPEEYQFSADLAIEDIIVNAELSEENAQKLQKAFDELSKRQREVLYLKYYQEVPYEEISELMDISYQSVRNLVSNALRAMRKYMGSVIISFFFLKMITKYF